MDVDVVTVFHRDENREQAERLGDLLTRDPLCASFTAVDNTVENRGFARACNLGAREGEAPVVAFLNPDLRIESRRFLAQALSPFHVFSTVVVAGDAFGKPRSHYYDHWGCQRWVCGACFFVRRDWWDKLEGFDEDYVWSFEETDFIRRTQDLGGGVFSHELPVSHIQPFDDEVDREYKAQHLEAAMDLFYERWPQGRF